MFNESKYVPIAAMALAFAAVAIPLSAQLTNLVEVTLDCTPHGVPSLVFKSDENVSALVPLTQVPQTRSGGTVWQGEIKQPPWIPAEGTIGSVRLRGARTDSQLSVKNKDDGAASFSFHCSNLKTRDVIIITRDPIHFTYLRTMPRNQSNRFSQPTGEKGAAFGEAPILDVRFEPYLIDHTTRRPPNAGDPFESLRLQFPPMGCGLLVNDSHVIDARQHSLTRGQIIDLLKQQRGASKACQAPSFAGVAINVDRHLLPSNFESIKLTLAPAGK